MRRITAEEVIEAYGKTGLTPIQEEWFVNFKSGSGPCACGLTAVAMAKGLSEVSRLKDISLPLRVRRTLDISFPYMDGFTMGFDGYNIADTDENYEDYDKWKQYQQGHSDGVVAWGLVNQMMEAKENEDHA